MNPGSMVSRPCRMRSRNPAKTRVLLNRIEKRSCIHGCYCDSLAVSSHTTRRGPESVLVECHVNSQMRFSLSCWRWLLGRWKKFELYLIQATTWPRSRSVSLRDFLLTADRGLSAVHWEPVCTVAEFFKGGLDTVETATGRDIRNLLMINNTDQKKPCRVGPGESPNQPTHPLPKW